MAERFAGEADFVAEAVACRRGDRLIFAGIDFRLPAGGALVLRGSNGSGKSSLLRILATLLTPAAGRLSWGGEPVARDPAAYRAALHYIGHLDAVKPALTPRETLRFRASLHGRAASEEAIAAALSAFGLAKTAAWPSRWLSAGQRRRLGLAGLIVAPASLWLLDEPTAALDGDGEARLLAAIADHRAAGGRVAIATHQPIALSRARSLMLDDFAPSGAAAAAAAGLW